MFITFVLAIAVILLMPFSWHHYAESKRLRAVLDSLADTLDREVARSAEVAEDRNLLLKKVSTLLAEVGRLEKEIPKARQDAIQASNRVKKGLTYQHFAPFEMDGIAAQDCRFMGNPIDFVVFVGLTAVQEGRADTLERIVLCDVKTGKAQLNKVQRRIRDCVREGRVEFLVFEKKEEDDVTEESKAE